jgi:hypothetical protein
MLAGIMTWPVLAFHVGLLDDSAFHSDGFAVDAQTQRILFVEGHDDLKNWEFNIC